MASVSLIFFSHALRVMVGPIARDTSIKHEMMITYLDGMILGMQSSIAQMQMIMHNANAVIRFSVTPYSENLWMIAMVAVTIGIK